MKRNIPLIVLLLTFLLRVMLPLTNAVYFFSELSGGKNGLWTTLYVASLLCEIAALVMLAVGLNDPKARRISAYIAFGLPGLHYAAILAAFIILPAARQFVGPVYMIVLTVGYLFTAAMGYLTLRSARDMLPCERKALPTREIDERVEVLHDKLNPNS